MKVAIIFIGTAKYLEFLPGYYENAEKFLFPSVDKHYFVFSDGDLSGLPSNVTVIPQEHLPFPYITLYRFDIINRAMEQIEEYDYLLFLDADTKVVAPVEFDEIFVEDKPLTGVHHPCHHLGMPPHDKFPGAFETNPASLCHIKPGEDISTYWQGCLWGGKMGAAKKLVQELDYRVKADENNGIIAVWHDESQINRYFLDNKHLVHTLEPQYAYPETFQAFMKVEPKIVHLAKNNSQYQV